MQNSPLVSIIVPIYNVADYLEPCVHSLMNQTYKNVELLLVDDGSTDQSLQIAQRIKKENPSNNITIYHKSNGGQASARNYGLKHAHGDYLMMIDSDDYLDKTAIEKCVKVAIKSNCDLVIFDYISTHQGKVQKYTKVGTGLASSEVFVWNKLYKKELWGNFRFPEGYWYEDLGVVPLVVAHARKVHKIDEGLYFYETSRQGSQSNVLEYSKIWDIVNMVERVFNHLKKENMLEDHTNEVEQLFIDHIIYNALLRKIVFIADNKIKVDLINRVQHVMTSYYPNWIKNRWSKNIKKLTKGSIIALAKLIIVNVYFKKLFWLGDLMWIVPRKVTGRRTPKIKIQE